MPLPLFNRNLEGPIPHLEQVLSHLRTMTHGQVEVLQETAECLTLRLGRHEDAILSVRVSDPTRPSFQVSYPKLIVKKDGSRHMTEVTVDHVLTEGLDWIVGQLLTHGLVKPEFE